jgi:dolichol kinase
MGLYVLDHLFFALAFAQKTYFQKIADPSEIASTAAVVFTINHIPAVFLPVILGYFWINSPAFVFVVATLLAITSFLLALMIPKNPNIGNETIFSKLIKNARP